MLATEPHVPRAGFHGNPPLSVCSASITESSGGGSMALARNWPMPPRRSSFMLRAISCSGVRNISGVMWVSSLGETSRSRHPFSAHAAMTLDRPQPYPFLIKHSRRPLDKTSRKSSRGEAGLLPMAPSGLLPVDECGLKVVASKTLCPGNSKCSWAGSSKASTHSKFDRLALPGDRICRHCARARAGDQVSPPHRSPTGQESLLSSHK